jgi:hypothetical protein
MEEKMMDVTRRLRAIERDRARYNALPVRVAQDKFRRFLEEAAREGIDLSAWQKRINSLARGLGFPDLAPPQPFLGKSDTDRT